MRLNYSRHIKFKYRIELINVLVETCILSNIINNFKSKVVYFTYEII